MHAVPFWRRWVHAGEIGNVCRLGKPGGVGQCVLWHTFASVRTCHSISGHALHGCVADIACTWHMTLISITHWHLRMCAIKKKASLQVCVPCLQSAQSAGSEGSLPEGSQVTLGYNLARVREAAGQLQTAAADYTSILDQFPGYLVCRQRLAAIACGRGDYAGAGKHLHKALEVAPDDPDTTACLGERTAWLADVGIFKQSSFYSGSHSFALAASLNCEGHCQLALSFWCLS